MQSKNYKYVQKPQSLKYPKIIVYTKVPESSITRFFYINRGSQTSALSVSDVYQRDKYPNALKDLN